MTLRQTSVAVIKSHAVKGPPTGDIVAAIDQLIEDKGYSRSAIASLGKANRFGEFLNETLLKSGLPESADEDEGGTKHVLDYAARTCIEKRSPSRSIERYRGTISQHRSIDRVLTAPLRAELLDEDSKPLFIGEGAAAEAYAPLQETVKILDVSNTPIAIIGYGAAGVMVAFGLHSMGFKNVTIYEGRGDFGIWAQPNVHSGSRNNPRSVNFHGQTLHHAPGDGRAVLQFLQRINTYHRDNNPPTKRNVKAVRPGHLSHRLSFDSEKDGSETFPIVINAMGHGKPVPMNDPARMSAPTGRISAVRWQNPLLTRTDVEGKRFIFIGLGNSTAEMLRVLHTFEDQGVQCDYRVLTHYPKDAVMNPSDTVTTRGRQFRVFRDLMKPDLTGFQGDLPETRSDYYRALNTGRIVTDVSSWDTSGNVIAVGHGRTALDEIEFNALYHLSGYRQDKATMKAMGCVYNDERLCIEYDFDGEIANTAGATGVDRVHAGYFGFGAVLDAPHNRNMTVIPGMAFRLPDLLFGVLMRAAQYKALKFATP